MNKEKLYRMYDVIINSGEVITERTFLINGISKPQEEIASLVESGTLKMIEPGKYRLASVENLYQYGVKLLTERYILRANLCFEKCYSIDPNHRSTCLQLFQIQLKKENYPEAFDILDKIMEIEPEIYQYDNNLYLYLLSSLTECPDKYKEQVKELKALNVISPEEENQDEKEMRREILKAKYPHAMYIFNNITSKNLKYSVERAVLKELLSQTINCEKRFRHYLVTLAEQKEYNLIVETLEKRREKRPLNTFDMQIYIICKTILTIKETNQIPLITVTKTNDFYKALKGNNFKLAEELNSRYLKYGNKAEGDDVIGKLLTELNAMIEEIEKTLPITEENPVEIKEVELEVISTIKEPTFLESLAKAKEEYDNGNYEECISICFNIIKKTEFSFAEIYILLGLSYYNLNDINLAIKYLQEAKKCSDIPNSQIKQMTPTLEDIKNEKDIKDIEEIAYYIKETKLSMKEATKNLGLMKEQILLIKLVYARDYYIEGNLEEGDKLIREVELDFSITEKVRLVINQLKINRNNYSKKEKSNSRSLKINTSNK